MKPSSHPLKGYFYIGTAAFLWGVSASLGRAAFTGRLFFSGASLTAIDPLIIAQTRATFACLILAAALILRRGSKAFAVPMRDVARFFALGVLGVAASNYLYYLAIQRTNVATAIILQYTAPVWVLLYSVLVGLQRLSWQRSFAVALAVAGCALTVGLGRSGGLRIDALGMGAAILAAFSFAFYNIAGHRILARHDRWKTVSWVLLCASIFWLFVNPPWKVAAARYSLGQWEFLLVFSLVSVLAPFSFYFAGLQYLEPTRAIVTSCLEPVFSISIAAVVLGEILHPLQAAGIILVLIAIILVQLSEHRGQDKALVLQPVE